MVESDFGLCSQCWAQTHFLGASVCDKCGRPVHGFSSDSKVHCDSCVQECPPWAQGRGAFLYKDVGRKLVLSLKHGDRTEVALPGAKWLAQAVQPILQANSLVVPVPLHHWRFLRRRYNQAALLAENLARLLKCEYCPDALVRPTVSGSLEGLSKKERKSKLENAIIPNPKQQAFFKGRSILLVDDVLTTGATLSAATRACLSADAKDVRVVTLARVAKDT